MCSRAHSTFIIEKAGALLSNLLSDYCCHNHFEDFDSFKVQGDTIKTVALDFELQQMKSEVEHVRNSKSL